MLTSLKGRFSAAWLFLLCHCFIGAALAQPGTWTQVGAFPGAPRENGAAFEIDGKAYWGTGRNTITDVVYTDFWEYDPATGIWTQRASLPGTPREGAVGFSVGHKGFIALGYNSPLGVYLDDIWEYDPSTDSWTQKTNFPGVPRVNAFSFAIDDKGYVGAGMKDFSGLNDFYSYEPATDSWTLLQAFPGSASEKSTGFRILDKGYAAMGYSNSPFSPNNELWEYDPGSDSWERKADCPMALSGVFAATNGPSAFIGGGREVSMPNAQVLEYSAPLDSWTFWGPGPIARPSPRAVPVGTKMYVATGSDSDNEFFEFELKPPPTATVVTADSLALVALRAAGGGSWTNETNWNTGPVNTWFGVTVHNFRVTELVVPNNGVAGVLPTSFGDLKGLRHLDLRGNTLAAIPEEFKNLTRLEILDLGNNLFEGVLPDIETFTSLTELRLDGNQFDAIPDLTGLPSLTISDVSNNKLTFEDLESQVSVPGIVYSPQKDFSIAHVSRSVGQTLTIASSLGGTANSYTWSKNGLSTGVTSANYSKSNVTLADGGDYEVEVSSGLVPGLTLSSIVSNVTISSATVPPVITSFSPPSAVAGTTIVINGSGFDPVAANNVVTFGSITGNVTSASATQLSVVVPVGANQELRVMTHGLTAISSIPFVPKFTSSGIVNTTGYTAPILVYNNASSQFFDYLRLGDLDGDNKPDMTFTTINGSDVLRNVSTGSITTTSFPSNPLGTMSGLTLSDFDADGKLDMMASPFLGDAHFFKNVSTAGTLNASSFSSTPVLTRPAYVDIDGDGRLDAVTTSGFGGSAVYVARNLNAAGSVAPDAFSGSVTFATGTNNYRSVPGMVDVKMADLDLDGKQDLLVHGYAFNPFQVGCCSGSFSILRNASTPGMLDESSFDPSYDVNPAAGYITYDIAIGDLDGDQLPELVLLGQGGATGYLTIFANHSTPGNISFKFGGTVPTIENFGEGSYADINIRDVTGDGKQDIVVGFQGSIMVYVNRPDALACSSFTFEKGVRFAKTSGTLYNKLEIADLNGDAKPDFVYSLVGRVEVMQNMIPDTWPVPTISSVTPSPVALGATVTLTGTGFSTNLLDNKVIVNGVRAVVQAATATSLTIVLPPTGIVTGAANLTLEVGNQLINGPSFTILPITRNGLHFDGVNDRVVATDYSPPGNALTVEAWVFLSQVSGKTPILYKQNEFQLNVTDGALQPQVWTSSENTFQAGTVAANTWTHLAMTYKEGGSLKAYVNGSLVQSMPVATGKIPDNFAFLFISQTFNGLQINGIVDEVAVWNSERTLAEIAADMSGNMPQSTALAAYYDFNQGIPGGTNTTVTTLFDRSCYARNGTLSQFALTGATSNWVNGLVLSAHTISSFSPSSGPTGTVVVINGTGFNPVASNNLVTFNGKPAVVTAATATTLTVTVPADATTGPIEVTIAGVAVVSSTNFTIINSITVNTQPSSQSVCEGTAVTLTTAATGTTNIVYQWQKLDGSVYVDVTNDANYSGASTAVLTIQTTDISVGGTYRCKISGDLAPDVYSADAVLTLNTVPDAPTTAGDQRCGTGTVTLTASGASTGQYRWYASASGGSSLSDTPGYTTPTLSSTTTFYAAINDGTCESSRTPVVATINSLPGAPSVAPASGCLPSSTVVLNASGGTAGQYRWYAVATGGTAIAGQTGGNFTTPLLSANTTYYVSINDGLCEGPRTAVLAEIRSCAPQINTATLKAPAGGEATINLASLATAVVGAIDINSFSIVVAPISGALASIDAGTLTVDYSGTAFVGIDRLTIEGCDVDAHCNQQEITVDVSAEIRIYNALSPNGDDKNEVFYIEYIDMLPNTKNNRVRFFNRWGSMVFEVDNYDNVSRVFTGHDKDGTLLPSGTYYYRITFEGDLKPQAGFLSLKH